MFAVVPAYAIQQILSFSFLKFAATILSAAAISFAISAIAICRGPEQPSVFSFPYCSHLQKKFPAVGIMILYRFYEFYTDFQQNIPEGHIFYAQIKVIQRLKK